MNLIHYPDEAAFNTAIAPHLAADPDANPRLLIGYPPIKEPLYVSDSQRAIFLRTDRTQRWLPSGRDAAAATNLEQAMRAFPVPDGISGSRVVAEVFAESFISRGAKVKLHLDMNFYRLGELYPAAVPEGEYRFAGPDDLDLLCGLVTDFGVEATGVHRKQADLRTDAIGWIENRMPVFWQVHGQVVAMLLLIPNGPGLLRLGAMYVLPDQRGHGYSKGLASTACQLARAQGNGICLNADIDHPFTNQMYQSLGFIKRSVLSDYRFTV